MVNPLTIWIDHPVCYEVNDLLSGIDLLFVFLACMLYYRPFLYRQYNVLFRLDLDSFNNLY